MAKDKSLFRLKILFKLLYKVFKEEYGYYEFLEIYSYPTLNKLKNYLFGIHHCFTVIGK